MNIFKTAGIVNALNRIIEKLGGLIISIGGDPADYCARAYLASDQLNLVHDTYTKINLTSKTYDPNGDFDITNKRYVAPIAGWYAVKANILFTNAIADKKYITAFYKNGVLLSASFSSAALAGDKGIVHTDDVYLEKGDYIELYGRSVSGGDTVDVQSGSTFTFLAIHKINKFSGGSMTQNLQKFRVKKTSAQNATSAGFTKITWDIKDYDHSNLFDITTNERFTAAVAGFYQINVQTYLGAVVTNPGRFLLVLNKNGTSVSQQEVYGAVGETICPQISDVIFLNVGDYLEAFIRQTSATANQPFTVSLDYLNVFSGHLLSQ